MKRTTNKTPAPERSKREIDVQRYLRKKRFTREREELDKKFSFTPLLHEDAIDPTKDAKRIRQAVEFLDGEPCFLLIGDLASGIQAMMLIAGHYIAGEVPLDTQFLCAMQRISDWHHGRVLPTDEEWSRVCTIEYARANVTRTLDAVDQFRKATRLGLEPSDEWWRGLRTVAAAVSSPITKERKRVHEKK